ncbi:MAG TPA: DUF2178 domain-containing protein [Methanoculleus sp.]|nr:DUF2178 domain-containing protein [Methanoculleus sp.]
MKQQTYRICIVLVAVGLFFALGLSLVLTSANMIVPAVAVAVSIAILALCRRNVTEVIEDELSTILHGKAALSAFEVTILIAAIGFAVLMIFSFTGGSGSSLSRCENGSILVVYGVLSAPPNPEFLYENTYLIPDPANLTIDDVVALDDLFAEGHRIRDTTRAFGAALGAITVLLTGLYGAFLWHYNRKYGA